MSKWSNWIDWAGGECPLAHKSEYMVRFRLGNEAGPMTDPLRLDWLHHSSGGDIIAYRYKIEESEMDADLRWLARNVDKWRGENYWLIASTGDFPVWFDDTKEECVHEGFTRAQWQAARQQLGLEPKPSAPEGCNYPNCLCPDKADVCGKGGVKNALPATQEEEDALQDLERKMNSAQAGEQDVLPEWWKGHKEARKQERYQDAKGEDWIDEFARTATVEEFRGAMKFTIGKYNRRAGKKDDLIKEVEKMRDYCCRWLEYESRFL